MARGPAARAPRPAWAAQPPSGPWRGSRSRDQPSPAVAAPRGLENHGAARLKPGDRHPEWGAGHVIEAHLVEEVHRLRVTAVLAADAEFQFRPCGAAFLGGDADHPAHAVGVDRLERGHTEDAQLDVAAEERALHVVAGEAPAHLGQVVRAE